MSDGYIDTNIFLRHILQDHADHSPRASALFRRVEQREITLRSTDPVVFEVVFTLQSFYKAAREEIRDSVLPLVELPGIDLPNKRVLRRVFDLYTATNLSFVDCYNVATMENLGLTDLYSFDRGYDRIRQTVAVRRLEP